MHHMKFDDKRAALEALGVSFAKPKHPEYSLLAKRHGSFSEWKYSQSPETLARAGFYYSGPGDRVKCFFCGKILSQWERDDDPWVEHAQWFPDCPFLLQCKGKSFVSEVQQIVAQQRPEMDSIHPAESLSYEQYKEQRGVVTSPSSPECSLQSTAAMKAIQMGYSEISVRKAVNILQTRHGNSRTLSLLELVDVILDLQSSDSGYSSIEDLSNEENLDVGESASNRRESNSENLVVKNAKIENSDRTTTSVNFGSANQQKEGCLSTENDDRLKSSGRTKDERIENDRDSGYDSESDEEENENSLDCTEKLKNENAELKETLFCRVCKDNTVSVIFLPCAHMCTCAQCYPAMKECPICTSPVKAVVKAFLV